MALRLLLTAITVLVVATSLRAAVDPARVDAALARAKEYLYKQQTGDNWERELQFHGDQATGHTALAVYALLASGESHTDPRIAKAVEYLKKTDTSGVYALGVRCQVWLALPQTTDTKRAMAKDAAALRAGLITDGDGKGFYAYNPSQKAWSLSRAQYAVLGMWAASQAGVEVPKGYWQLIEKAWIDAQDPSGAWAYKAEPTDEHPITPGITAVGIATLYILQDELHAAESAVPRGNIVNPNIDKGMKWIIDNFSKVATDEKYPRDFPYSTIFAIERIGLASGLKYFGTIDWYEKGTNWLLGKQYNNGAWPAEFGNVPSTCFAMLFLSRGRAPNAINKLDYTLPSARKPAPWNQRPRDVANASRWIGRQLERDINWQIVNLASAVEDWFDAPILYVSGSEELALDDPARQKIKLFIEQGGIVLGNADAQSRPFATSFRKLGQDLFPEYEFRELPADHVIYTSQQFSRDKWRSKPSVLALSNDVRELMILLPQGDLARTWQTQTLAGREEHWQLISNLFLYGADQTNLRRRGESHWVARNDSITAVRKVSLARLKYAGNWDPEPGGWRRLTALLHNRNRLDVEVSAVDLGGDSLDAFKLAHLTGTGGFKLDEPARQKLRAFLDAGGTLLMDAAGGSSEFATAMEREAAALIPDAPVIPLQRDHPMLKLAGAEIKTFGYRPHAARMLGSLKNEPRLKAIELKGRIAIVLSREDLSAGLVGQPVDGIVGYDPATATEIVSRIVLYAGK